MKQFGTELVPDDLDFPMGYMKGGSKVWIRTATDVLGVWSFVRSNESVSVMVFLRVHLKVSVERIPVVIVTLIVTILGTRKSAKRRERCLRLKRKRTELKS